MDVQKTSKNSINIYISSFVSSSLNWIVNQVWASVASFKMVSDYISHLEAGQGDRPDRPIPAGPRFTLSPRYSRKQHHGIYRLSYLLQGSVNRRVLWGSWPRSQFVFDLFQAWPCVLALWRKCVWNENLVTCYAAIHKFVYQFAIYTRWWIRRCFILKI